jgi:hypothetical protein
MDVAAGSAVMTFVIVAWWNTVRDALTAFAAEIDFHKMAPPNAGMLYKADKKSACRIKVTTTGEMMRLPPVLSVISEFQQIVGIISGECLQGDAAGDLGQKNQVGQGGPAADLPRNGPFPGMADPCQQHHNGIGMVLQIIDGIYGHNGIPDQLRLAKIRKIHFAVGVGTKGIADIFLVVLVNQTGHVGKLAALFVRQGFEAFSRHLGGDFA